MRRNGIIGLALLGMVLSVAGQTFTEVNVAAFEPMAQARSEWVDFDNDGLLDLLVAGTNTSGTHKVIIYYNNGDDTFDVLTLANWTNVGYDIGDYNKDGFVDLILSGNDASDDLHLAIFESNSGTSFTEKRYGLEPFTRGGIAWIDVDADTDLDIVASGLDDTGDPVLLLYEFQSGSYVPISTSAKGLINGDLQAFDANGDALYEVIISGFDHVGDPQTFLYSIDQQFAISEYQTTLDPYAFNRFALGDFNEDGFLDIGVTGYSDPSAESSDLLSNTATSFAVVSPFLDDLDNSSIELGDLDNDGLLDIVLMGTDETNAKYFYYYQNSVTYSFAEAAIGVETIYSGDAALGDYDNDGDVDLFQVGNSLLSLQANLYRSDMAVSTVNAAPSVPAGLTVVTFQDSVTFSWSAATDDIRNSSSLTYALYLSNDPSGADLVMSPLSDVASGYRRSTKPGNAGLATTKTIYNIPEGTYYWGVQAIDNNHQASAFASEETFAVCYQVSLGRDTAICQYEDLTLEVTDPEATVVNWYTVGDGLQLSNSLAYTHTALQKDTIVAEITKSYGCTVYDSLVVDVHELPSFDLGSDTANCYASGLTLSMADFGITGLDSVNWYSLVRDSALVLNSEVVTYFSYEQDTLVVEVFNVNGCVNYDSLIVDVYALPAFDLGNDTTICYAEGLTVSVTDLGIVGLDSVNWYSLVRDSALVRGSEEVTYFSYEKDTLVAEVFNANGCVNYDSLIVDVYALPAFDLGNDTTICYAESLAVSVMDLGIAGLDSVNWYSLVRDSALVLNQEAVTYFSYEKDTLVAEVFNVNGCVNYDSLIVDVYALPAFDLGNDTSICYQQVLSLTTGSSYAEVNWYSQATGDTLLRDSWFFNYQVLETDTLIAEVYNHNGCVNYDSIIIVMDPLPVFDLGDDPSICYGDSLELAVAGSWAEVNWFSTGDQLLAAQTSSYPFKVEEDQLLWAQVWDDKGCVDYDTVWVTALSLPEFDLPDERVYCYGDSIGLEVPLEAKAFTWSNAEEMVLSTTSTWATRAAASDSIWLLVESDAGCFYQDSMSVQVNPLPIYDITGSLELCYGDSAEFTTSYSGAHTVEWSASAGSMTNEESFFFKPLASQYLRSWLQDANQCVTMDSVEVIVYDRPQVFAGVDTLICHGASVTLGQAGLPDNTYHWSPAETLSDALMANPVATPSEPITYVLEQINEHGCNSFDTVYVEVNPDLTIDAGVDQAICLGDSVVIGGGPTAQGSQFGYSYAWSPAPSLLDPAVANPTAFPEESIWYTVEVRTHDCLVEYDSVLVTVNYQPEIEVSPQQSVGGDQSVTLEAYGGVEYLWSPENTVNDPSAQFPEVSPLETTLYTVQVTDENGCVTYGEVNVLVQNVLFIPNLFTPNGDGQNDYLMVYGSGIRRIDFAIYELNGQQVYQTSDVRVATSVGWDGRFKGALLPNGTYVWSISGEFFDGSPLRFEGKSKGTFKLIR